VRRFAADPALSKHVHLVNLQSTLNAALADDVLSGRESEDIKEWITRLVGDGYSDTGLPSIGNTTDLPNMLSDHREIIFPKRTFVVTGALRIAPRSALAELVRLRDGIFAERITLETNYLIVAPTASRDWRATHFGTKIETAQRYISQGSPLRFVPEHVFEEVLR
jgi:NAD-dependent DNA ligase